MLTCIVRLLGLVWHSHVSPASLRPVSQLTSAVYPSQESLYHTKATGAYFEPFGSMNVRVLYV
jgi:hypothetical protein